MSHKHSNSMWWTVKSGSEKNNRFVSLGFPQLANRKTRSTEILTLITSPLRDWLDSFYFRFFVCFKTQSMMHQTLILTATSDFTSESIKISNPLTLKNTKKSVSCFRFLSLQKWICFKAHNDAHFTLLRYCRGFTAHLNLAILMHCAGLRTDFVWILIFYFY